MGLDDFFNQCDAEVLTFFLQVLAVDLLNPSAAAEAKKHKLKVRLDHGTIPLMRATAATAASIKNTNQYSLF